MRKFLFCSLGLLFPGAYFVQAQSIKISVQKGQQYKVETSSQMTSSMNMGGEPFETSMESTSTNIFKVTDLNKNEIELESTCTHISSHSTIMGEERNYDSDKNEDNDPATSKMLSKRIGKSKKIVVDRSGKVIKEEKPGKTEDGEFDMAWMFTRQVTELFMPEFIGKEFKEGDSFPVATSFSKEKPSTSFSLNKETVSIADTGTYTIDSIRNGIASISYTGSHVMTMQMKMGDELIPIVSKSRGISNFRVDINSGIVISRTTTEESVTEPGKNDPSNAQTYKSTTTTKITLIE